MPRPSGTISGQWKSRAGTRLARLVRVPVSTPTEIRRVQRLVHRSRSFWIISRPVLVIFRSFSPRSLHGTTRPRREHVEGDREKVRPGREIARRRRIRVREAVFSFNRAVINSVSAVIRLEKTVKKMKQVASSSAADVFEAQRPVLMIDDALSPSFRAAGKSNEPGFMSADAVSIENRPFLISFRATRERTSPGEMSAHAIPLRREQAREDIDEASSATRSSRGSRVERRDATVSLDILFACTVGAVRASRRRRRSSAAPRRSPFSASGSRRLPGW